MHTKAAMQKPMKNHCGMYSGFNSATYGEAMLAARQNMLHMPIEVAARLTGKRVLFARYTALKPAPIPSLPMKM